MKIVITGGAGFIGSHLAESLYKNSDLHVIDNLSTGHIENINKFKSKISFIILTSSVNENKIDDVIKGSDIIFIFRGIVPACNFLKNIIMQTLLSELLQSMVRNRVPKLFIQLLHHVTAYR